MLLCEPSSLAASSTPAALEEAGFVVTIEHCAEEGFRRAHQERFAVVIADVTEAPFEGGLALIKKLRRDSVLSRASILATTSAGHRAADAARAAGADLTLELPSYEHFVVPGARILAERDARWERN